MVDFIIGNDQDSEKNCVLL